MVLYDKTNSNYFCIAKNSLCLLQQRQELQRTSSIISSLTNKPHVIEVRPQMLICFVLPYLANITMAVLPVSLEQDNCHQTILSGEISLLLFISNRAQDLYAIIMDANWCVGCNLCQTMVFFPLAVCDNQKPFSNTVRTYVFSSFFVLPDPFIYPSVNYQSK